MVDSEALSALLVLIDEKLYKKVKLSLDNPVVIGDTINMMKVMREIESEIRNIMNEQIK